MVIVVLSGSFVYFTMADAQFYVDEATYARLGYALIHGHLATTSSLWPLYYQLGYGRSDFPTPFGSAQTVEPYLDHPPLVPLLLIPVLVAGVSPRLLPIIFSSLTTFLIFSLLRSQRVLAWASALAWIGLFVTHQILSMLFLDAGVAFFSMLTLIFTSVYNKTGARNYLYLAGIIAGASALSKEYGVATLLYLLVFLLYTRAGSIKNILQRSSKPFLLGLGIASTWPLYGLAIAAPLFLAIIQANASRSFLFGANLNLLAFVTLFNYTSSTMYYAGVDPILLIGWLGIGYSLWKRKLPLVQLSLLSYLGVVLGLRYAWFYTTIPLFPFFAIGIGGLLTDFAYGLRNHIARITGKTN